AASASRRPAAASQIERHLERTDRIRIILPLLGPQSERRHRADVDAEPGLDLNPRAWRGRRTAPSGPWIYHVRARRERFRERLRRRSAGLRPRAAGCRRAWLRPAAT